MTVKQIQWQLFYLAYYAGYPDGIRGSMTTTGIKKFQSANGVMDTGSWCANTESKSVEIIKSIQSFLNSNIGSRLVVDGLAGNATKIATAQYQEKVGLVADGIAGSKTRSKMGIFDNQANNTVVIKPTTSETNKNTGDVFWDGIKHFEKSEFKCKCGGRYCTGYPAEPNHDLVRIAEQVRNHFNAPMTVSSGLRCTRHNANEGGVYNSRHLTGKAMDFCVKGKTASQVLAYVNTIPGIRYSYAINSNYVHMDVN